MDLPALPALLHLFLVPAVAIVAVARSRRLRVEALERRCVECEAAGARRGMEAPLEGAPSPIGLSKDASAVTKRENYIDWHDYFMSVAMLSAFRSKDPNRQVGACIINPSTLCIVGIGYNGFPWGCSDSDLPWARKGVTWLDTKYPYVCHAEVNAILNKNSETLRGCRIYVTLFPCNECAKLIIQSRIEEVVYLSDGHKDLDAMKASRKLFSLAGVKLRQHTPSCTRVVVDFESELCH